MVNNIPVNGWPQLKDLEAVQPTLDRLDKIEAWKRTVKEETFTGDDITIENALALPARSLITEISAIQDLHGQSAPYVGGAGKNKLPMTVASIKANNIRGTWSGNTYTVANGTFDILTDADGNVTGIEINGTFTATVSIKLLLPTPKQDSYILTGCPSGGGTSTYTLWGGVRNSDDTGWITSFSDKGSGYNFSVSAESAYIQVEVEVKSGYTANHVIFKPMIRLATETDATFAPYSNICPISGRTAVVLTRSDGDEISEDFTIQLGTTVYGAEINWDTGVMTVTGGAVDLGDLTWSAVNGSRFLSVNEMPNVKIDTSVSAPRNAICSQYVWKKGGDLFNLDDAGFSYYIEGGENRLFVKDLRYSDAASFKAAMSGVTLVYELATPTTIQLTPTQLEMLKGYNHITLSDGYGTIELKALTGANWS